MKYITNIYADGMYHPGRIGSVPQGEDFLVRLKLPLSEDPSEIQLICKNDRDEYFHAVPMEQCEVSEDPDSFENYQVYEASLSTNETGLFWYYFYLKLNGEDCLVYRQGMTSKIMGGTNQFTSFQLTVYDPAMKTPEFIKGGAYYHILVDRFHHGETSAPTDKPMSPERPVIRRDDWGALPEWRADENGEILNNDFFGGNLAGIREKLPYLSDLGVTCLYLSPIFEAYSNHKYDTADYEKIDPFFGDEKDFSDLCAEAKKLGIRIILDGVFNHTGSDSKYFNRYHTYPGPGAYESKESPYYSWYEFIHYPNVYQSWWGIRTLPAIYENDPSYREYILGENGIIRKWLRLGASGWRLDVVDELPDDFVMDLKTAARAEKEDALIIGEVWEDASTKEAYGVRRRYFQGHELDSVMNYPLKEAIIAFVRYCNSRLLAETIDNIVSCYPPMVVDCLMNNLGTHDTMRILTALGGLELNPDAPRRLKAETHMSEEELANGLKLLRLASLLQMTLPGVPCIYYGDEAGMEGYNDPFNRCCYPWGHEDRALISWYRTLLQIRKEYRVFSHSSFRLLAFRHGFFAFCRETEDDFGSEYYQATTPRSEQVTIQAYAEHETLICAVNRSGEVCTIPAHDPAVRMINPDHIILEHGYDAATGEIEPDGYLLAIAKGMD